MTNVSHYPLVLGPTTAGMTVPKVLIDGGIGLKNIIFIDTLKKIGLDFTSYRRVKITASMLFESVSEYGSPVAQVDLGTQESCRVDATVYPGLGSFGPYVQQLMILILKSTQNWGLQQSAMEVERDLEGG